MVLIAVKLKNIFVDFILKAIPKGYVIIFFSIGVSNYYRL